MPSPKLNKEQAQKHLEAMKGNKFNLGLKTEKAKQAAFESFCQHLADGQPKQSWYYKDKNGNHCAWETMEKLIDNKEFDLHLLQEAHAKRYGVWFERGTQLAIGKLKGSPNTWESIMRNMFGWSRDPHENSQPQQVTLHVQSYPMPEECKKKRAK